MPKSNYFISKRIKSPGIGIAIPLKNTNDFVLAGASMVGGFFGAKMISDRIKGKLPFVGEATEEVKAKGAMFIGFAMSVTSVLDTPIQFPQSIPLGIGLGMMGFGAAKMRAIKK